MIEIVGTRTEFVGLFMDTILSLHNHRKNLSLHFHDASDFRMVTEALQHHRVSFSARINHILFFKFFVVEL